MAESIKEMLEKAKEMDKQVKQKKQELKDLQNQKREICFDNLANVVYPFVQEYVAPVHKLYTEVLYRNKDKYSSYYAERWLFHKSLECCSNLTIELLPHYDSLRLDEHCSYASSWYFGYGDRTNNYYLSDYGRRKDALPLEWFDLVGTVEQANEFCEELKEVAELECNRLLEMLESENAVLLNSVLNVKEELEKASSVKVNKEEDSIKLILNGQEYTCTPVEK